MHVQCASLVSNIPLSLSSVKSNKYTSMQNKEIKTILHGGKENLSSTTFKIKIYINSWIKNRKTKKSVAMCSNFLIV